MNARVTVHDLGPDSFLTGTALRHRADGCVSITLDDHTQPHFRSHADMIAFGEKLAALPISLPSAAA